MNATCVIRHVTGIQKCVVITTVFNNKRPDAEVLTFLHALLRKTKTKALPVKL